MIIEGEKNLKFFKRALCAYLSYLAIKSMRADEKMAVIEDTEFKQAEEMLYNIENNLKRISEG
jgi:hypothetical protein